MTICPNCGQENPEMARFCLACAAPLTEVLSAREERKVVTVLFADLVGFTARAAQMDPEDVHAFVAPYWAHVRSELERHGGTVEKYIGDAVMALFGAPVAHEDDPERAVRAALAIRDWAAQEQEEIRVRIAVNTGEALVRVGAKPLSGEGMATGDVVNTASRLQNGAPVNGILIGGTTYRATRNVIECRQVGPVEAKGKTEPIPAWEVVQARSRFGVDLLLQAQTPLIARDREVELLVSALARVREERSPRLVTLVGVPGIGKSRLVYELMQRVASEPELVTWRQGRSLPYGEGVSFWALAEMVKAQAGILETDADGDAERKLADAVENIFEDEAEARWIESHLRLLVGLGGETVLSGDRRGEAFAAWRRFFEAMAERRPLVLVFEDLHWADESMFDFVDHLVDWASGVALLVVCTARPELLERRSGWGEKPSALTISLSPLSDDETVRLIARLLDRPVLPAELQAELLARAGGNPLFAEQYVRVLAERTGGEELRLPESVQGLIAARLDGLSPEEKSLLQKAAVVGKVFWLGGVAALGGLKLGRAEELLHGLERKQFVQRARRSSLAAETEYVFGHVLVRDVAYGQIPRAGRAQTHVRAAEWLTSVIGDRGDHVEVLADHYVRALELIRAAGAATIELERKARTALRAAGDRALTLNAFDAAATFYRQALELWPIEDPLRAEVLFGYGRALRWAEDGGADSLVEARDALIAAGDRESAGEAAVLLFELAWRRDDPEPGFAHLTRAAELVGDLGPSRSKAYVLTSLARYHTFQGPEAEAIRFGRQALAIAEDLGLDDIRAHALNYIGAARVRSGDFAGLKDLERSLEIARAISTPFSLGAYYNLAGILAILGQFGRAFDLYAEGLEEARRFGIASEVEYFERAMGGSLLVSGRWDELLRDLDAEIAMRGGSTEAIPDLSLRALIREARDDAQGALEDATTALQLARSLSGHHSLPGQDLLFALVVYARTLLSVGRADEARALADELTRLLADAQPTLEWADGWIDLAVVMTSLDRTEELIEALGRTPATPWVDAAYAYAAGDFVHAAETYATIGSPHAEALARLRAAQALIDDGRRAEADEQLQRALTFYRSVGATRYIREGETLVAASA